MGWLSSRKYGEPGQKLYLAISTAARQTVLFEDLTIPDSFDGRFDAVVLHLALVVRRLESLGDDGHMFARQLVSVFVDDMDRTVREMGVGDMSVGKHVKRMAQAFYGRVAAYDAALSEGAKANALETALARNLFAGREQAKNTLTRMAHYVIGLNRRIEEKSLADFLGLDVSAAMIDATNEAAGEATS